MADAELTTCGPEHSEVRRTPIPVQARGRHLVVDIHCHLSTPAADDLVRARHPRPPPGVFAQTSAATREVGRLQMERVGGQLAGITQRLADMDRLGVDLQVISPPPTQYFYYADADVGLAAARAINERIAEAVAAHPDRLAGLGSVPLQAPELAVAELRRAVGDLGLRGVEICTNVNGRDLADPALRPVFAAAEELGVVIFIHPLGFAHERFAEHYFSNVLGNPLESALAVGHLIFGGVLETYPGLKVCVAHGGGYLPAYFGRMDHAARARPDCREHIRHPPTHYLRKLWFDTLVHDKTQLAALIASHGADKLCLGSDYPFDMGEDDPVGFHAHLADGVRAKIVGMNVMELLGLEVARR
jgi:aminocarboxymuconate-semialdehyde decarboxylase